MWEGMNVIKNNESPIGIGIVWMCPECIDINIREGLFEKAKDQTKEIIVNRDNKRKRDEIIVAAEIHTEVNEKLNSAMRAKLNAERNKKLNRDKDQGEEVIVVLEEGINIEETNKAQNKKHPNNTRTNNMKSQKICIYWQRGRCKFEERCWYLHPKKCEDILKFGECYNLECKHIHPKMCINMNERGFCDKGR